LKSLRFDKVPQVGAERDAVAEIMPAFNELFKNRIELPVGSLYERCKDKGSMNRPGFVGDSII
jgi:hypothetical protein